MRCNLAKSKIMAKLSDPSTFTRVLRLRLKDKHAPWRLRALSREVNFVWNFLNETSHNAIQRHGRFLSGFDLDKLGQGGCQK
jgi:putative transposase